MRDAPRAGHAALMVIALLVAALLVSTTPPASASWAPPSPTAAAPPPDLRIGFLEPIQGLNPYIGFNEPSLVLYSLLYDFPFSFDENGSLVPNLIAHASCISANCSVWSYTVRQGVYWSDGSELTAADVNFTWNFDSQHLIQLYAYEPYFNHVVVCTAATRPKCGAVLSPTVPWNVTVYFDRAFVAGESLLAPIVQEWQWSAVTPLDAQRSYPNKLPIGTGPFIAGPNIYNQLLGEPTTPIHLIRNPSYHVVGGTMPSTSIEDLYIYTFTSASAMATALEAGQLDLAQFTRSTIAPVVGQPNILVQSTLQAIQTWNYVGIQQCDTSHAHSVLNPARWDVNVRQALAHATNKDAIVQSIYGGQGVRGDSLISPISPAWWYDPVAGGDNLTFNLQTANAILNQSGYTTWSGGSFGHGFRIATNPIPLSIQSSTGAFQVENITNVTKIVPAGQWLNFTIAVRPPSLYPEEYATAQYLQTEWAKVGVHLTVKVETTEAGLTSDVYACNVDMYIWFWSSEPDPNYMISMQSSWTLDGWNDNLWVNTSYNRLYLAEVGDASVVQRQADVKGAEKIQYDAAVDLIYLYPYGEWAMRTDLWQGWGNWAAHPYRQLNVPWGANPLWFNLTCPSCAPLAALPAPTAPSLTPSGNISVFAGVNLALTAASSDADATVQLNFTSDWGDGNLSTAVTPSTTPTVTTNHAWTSPGAYRVNVLVYDGHNAPVWSTDALTANVVTRANVGYLVGTVQDTSGHPIPGAFIDATPGNWANSSDASGAYNVSLPAGTYAVTVSAPSAASATKTGIVVTAGGVTTLDFTLAVGQAWISGTVVDAASGQAIPSATVLVTPSAGNPYSGTSNASGQFNLTVAPGTYVVSASATGYLGASETNVVATVGHTTTLTMALVPSTNPIRLGLARAFGQPAKATTIQGNITAPAAGTWVLDFGDGTNFTSTHGTGTTPFAAVHVYAAQGTYVTRLTATSGSVQADITASAIVDGTPPVTLVKLQGAAGTGPWFHSSVTVNLTATDALSGVAETFYGLDGGPLQPYAGNFTISAQGTHTLRYLSEDRALNLEPIHILTVGVDTAPPSVHVASPSEGAALTSSHVTITWAGNDSLSGMAGYAVRLDGGISVEVGMNTSVSVDLSDGTHTITVFAVDAAGNVASASVTFHIDTDPFSPSGPYAGAPTYAIIGIVAAIAGFVLWQRRKRLPGPPNPPPEERQP